MRTISFVGLLSSLAIGCAAPADPVGRADEELVRAELDDFVLAPQTPDLAAVRWDNGDSVVFQEPEEGIIVVVGDFVANRVPAALKESITSDSALYEALSGQAAPLALRQAEARMIEHGKRFRETPGDDAPVTELSPGKLAIETNPRTLATSASEFDDAHCRSTNAVVTFSVCWPSATGNAKVERKVYWMHGYVHAPTHKLRFTLRYKKWGALHWTGAVDKQVLVGRTAHIEISAMPRVRAKMEVKDNEGHPMRLSVYGNEI